MSGLVDLHLHSTCSCDGDFSPEELVLLARDGGFRAISIADHDTVAAYPGAILAGEKAGVEVIPSMEVTTLFEEREFHLLLPFLEWDRPAVGRIIERMNTTRLAEAGERVDRLRGLGLKIGWDEVWEKSNGLPPLGVKIAQILLDKPGSGDDPALAKYYTEENRDYGPYLFYKDYFAEGQPAYVPKRHIGLLDVLDLVPETGGVPVLSHPGAYFQQATRGDLAVLKGRGLEGLEVYTFYHTPEQTSHYERLAAEMDLIPTAGSDFHGRIKPHVAFGALREGRYWMVEGLRERRRNGTQLA